MIEKTIIVTDNALNYLLSNLKKEDDDNLIVYVSVVYPLSKYAHVNVTFCKHEDINNNDLKLMLMPAIIYIDHASIEFLRDSVIDFRDDKLVINAPNVHRKNIDTNMRESIKSLFENEINVILSQHGGFIELVDIVDEKTIVIKFHGGCQGCGMVGYTLNNYIEKMIKKHFPQIENINDITSHEVKSNAYY